MALISLGALRLTMSAPLRAWRELSLDGRTRPSWAQQVECVDCMFAHFRLLFLFYSYGLIRRDSVAFYHTYKFKAHNVNSTGTVSREMMMSEFCWIWLWSGWKISWLIILQQHQVWFLKILMEEKSLSAFSSNGSTHRPISPEIDPEKILIWQPNI